MAFFGHRTDVPRACPPRQVIGSSQTASATNRPCRLPSLYDCIGIGNSRSVRSRQFLASLHCASRPKAGSCGGTLGTDCATCGPRVSDETSKGGRFGCLMEPAHCQLPRACCVALSLQVRRGAFSPHQAPGVGSQTGPYARSRPRRTSHSWCARRRKSLLLLA